VSGIEMTRARQAPTTAVRVERLVETVVGELPLRVLRSIAAAPGRVAGRPAWWQRAEGVVALALVVQGLMLWWTWHHDLVFGLGDAGSRLTIAGRLWGSTNLGLGQLGTGWLPLPQLLLSVPSLAGPLWHTGLAGAVVGIPCAAAAGGAVFRIAERAGAGRAGAWAAALVMIANPSWSYAATAPSAEPVLIACLCLATAGLMRWASSQPLYSAGLIVLFCGLPTAAAMLSGYEGWAFFAAALALMSGILWRRVGWGPLMRRQLFAYSALPVGSALWWFCFNWAITGDLLGWARGPYSSSARTGELARLGLLPALHQPLTATTLYGRTLLEVIGTGVAVAAIAGLVATIVSWRGLRGEVWLLLLAPSAAVVGALWVGQTLIELRANVPHGLENTRYGLDGLPFAAVAAAQVLRVTRLRSFRLAPAIRYSIAMGLVLAVGGGFLAAAVGGRGPGGAVVVAEAKRTAEAGSNGAAAAEWLGLHARSGVVLVDDVAFTQLPQTGIDLHRIVARFSGKAWRRTLADPDRATWVLAQPGNPADEVWAALSRRGALASNLYPLASFGSQGVAGGYYVVYEREDPNEAAQDQLIPPPAATVGRTQ
jgi:hypothetical protein